MLVSCDDKLSNKKIEIDSRKNSENRKNSKEKSFKENFDFSESCVGLLNDLLITESTEKTEFENTELDDEIIRKKSEINDDNNKNENEAENCIINNEEKCIQKEKEIELELQKNNYLQLLPVSFRN